MWSRQQLECLEAGCYRRVRESLNKREDMCKANKWLMAIQRDWLEMVERSLDCDMRLANSGSTAQRTKVMAQALKREGRDQEMGSFVPGGILAWRARDVQRPERAVEGGVVGVGVGLAQSKNDGLAGFLACACEQ